VSTSAHAVLLLSCPDQKGLVAGVSQFIYERDGNILSSDQHTDAEQGMFLQRIEWDLEGFGISRPEIAAAFQSVAHRFSMTWQLRFSDIAPRMAIFVSRLDHCLQDLLWRARTGELAAEVVVVVSNHEDLRQSVEMQGLAYARVEPRGADAEARIRALLQAQNVELVVLARYMQLLGPQVVAAYPNRIVNIHHSFLPAFAGGRPYHQAYERGVKVIGATAHYVTAELDQGPIIEQGVAHVSHRDTLADLVRKGRDLERVVLARALHLHLRHRVLVYGNKTVVFE
jgi:formyltetrahydrofolate deformylase